MNHTKVAIIGAGPAGISCAVQLKRYGIDFLMFEKNQVGGLLRNAYHIENYLGFENGLSGYDLVKKFKKNLEIYNIEPVHTIVQRIIYADNLFHIDTGNGIFTSEFLVAASGTRPKRFEANNSDFNSEIIYDIADLDRKGFADKSFAIIGAGDAAFDYALNLINNFHVPKVTIINKYKEAKCIKLLKEKVAKIEKINYLTNIIVEKMEETNEKIVLYCMKTDNHFDKSIINADCILAATGREPQTEYLCEELISDVFELKQQGLFYTIGDMINGKFRQVSIASGEGLKTAMQIYQKLAL
jgi:thioredoxin reductase